jgi:hypothetical protein
MSKNQNVIQHAYKISNIIVIQNEEQNAKMPPSIAMQHTFN